MPELGLPETITGIVRLDKRTKRLTGRLSPATSPSSTTRTSTALRPRASWRARVGAVVNVAESMTGRYPNSGPLIITAAGIPLIDGVGRLAVRAHQGRPAAHHRRRHRAARREGRRHGHAPRVRGGVRAARPAAKSMGTELERFAQNTLEYLRQEKHLLLDEPDLPDIAGRLRGTPGAHRGAWRATTRRTSRCFGRPATCATSAPS